MSKTKNLEPWLAYFAMLGTYEEKGFLEMNPERNEAFITRAAFMTLTESGTPKLALKGIFGYIMFRTAAAEGYGDFEEILKALKENPGAEKPERETAEIVKRGREIAEKVREKAVILHIVAEDKPHDLLCTVLQKRRRRWYWPWSKKDTYKAITY